ncbi:melanoma-derived growth regulatory protein isoform X1 [Alligator sinensis]|uniref:Melanoma-derived growth regulatory protein isoform X1 n=1 Tax=Alligator sinensis TaxID=38654 RepID=A0A3Q0HB92_ALLSI|nr:melanoma-derived growth regulatory protein isoform X1 [Alligator sinensis]
MGAEPGGGLAFPLLPPAPLPLGRANKGPTVLGLLHGRGGCSCSLARPLAPHLCSSPQAGHSLRAPPWPWPGPCCSVPCWGLPAAAGTWTSWRSASCARTPTAAVQGDYYGEQPARLGYFPSSVVQESHYLKPGKVDVKTDRWDFYCP